MLTAEGFLRPGRDIAQMKIKVLRGFYAPVGGRNVSVSPGEVVEVPRTLALEIIAARKAEAYKAPVISEPDLPPPVEDMPEAKPKKRGNKDVG